MNGDFRLGPWLVEPSLNAVSGNGTTTHLEPKVMGVLVCLAERPGEPVSKDKLLHTVWPDTFVGEGVLTRSVSELRRVLEDEAHEPRFIQTIAKRGYRLVAPVTPLHDASPQKPAAPVAEPAPSQGSGIRRRPVWLRALALSSSAVVLLGALLSLDVGAVRARLEGLGDAPKIHSLAVLPLQNLSGDPAQESFADDMTEELITDLAHIRALKVISRTSAMRFKKTDKPLPEIASTLGVDGIVEGSVVRSADRVRVTAQLIYAPRDTHVWAQSYDRDLRDVYSLVSEVAGAIAAEIQVKVTPQEQAHLQAQQQPSLKSHELFLQGTYFLAQPRGCQKAVEFFQQALQVQPDTRGYVALARAYQCLSQTDAAPREVLPKAQAAALQALRMNEDFPAAHLILAQTKAQLDWDWAGAEKEFQRALELDPNSSDAHLTYAFFLDDMGRMQEAETEHLLAQQVDPLNETMNEFFYHTRQYDQAIDVLRQHLDSTGDAGVCWQLGILYDQKGMHDEAIACWERMFVVTGYDPEFGLAAALRRGYAKSGHAGAVRELLRKLEALSQQRHVPPDMMAYWYESVGEKDRAFAWLEKAREERNGEIIGLKTDLEWDGLRSDPRFDVLLRRVGLPQVGEQDGKH